MLQLGPLTLPSRFCLAPLAGYTNLPFRRAVRELGGLGLATTDLVSARALVRSNSRRTHELIETCPEDRPLAIQIYGSDVADMTEAARRLAAHGASVIDINMGCPVDKVTRGGGGSAMMCDVVNTIDLVARVVASVPIPVTVKMRLGWDEADLSAPKFAREFEKVGVAAVTIHGRTRAQGFGGGVNLDGIRAVVEAVERIPIIGNGDVRSIAAAERMLLHTGCEGIAIGRGALLNPWIFGQLSGWHQTGECPAGGDYHDRVRFMSRHFHLLLNQFNEKHATITFRKVANWYCRVLRPGREIQQTLMMLDSARTFDDIVNYLLEKGPPPRWERDQLPEIVVPKGPIEHW
ncbi:MAG: tRNA dihydrouridine synthase DusB [Gemmataceae bacterium]